MLLFGFVPKAIDQRIAALVGLIAREEEDLSRPALVGTCGATGHFRQLGSSVQAASSDILNSGNRLRRRAANRRNRQCCKRQE
jgi:hypothetical protein